ncbi:MAG: hypothetical protein WCT10_01400 [Patescibacteria group bacterium]|jgi:hypothetical protein
MSEKFEPTSTFAESEPAILDRPEFQDFIRERQIRPEDLPLVEELAAFPKDLAIAELHNLFNANHERSGQALENLLLHAQDGQKKSLYGTALRFFQAYDWTVSYNLTRLLEKI